MAGLYDAQGVTRIGLTHGPHRSRPADSPRELAVGYRATVGQRAQRSPDRELEFGTAGTELQVLEGPPLAAEVLEKRKPCLLEMLACTRRIVAAGAAFQPCAAGDQTELARL